MGGNLSHHAAAAIVVLMACGLAAVNAAADSIPHAPYGTLPDGRQVDVYTMQNANGVTVKFLSLGGCITEIDIPDRKGDAGNIVLGHDGLQGYNSNTGYFGAIVGRYANRVAKGSFSLNGQTYHLPINNGANSLHG